MILGYSPEFQDFLNITPIAKFCIRYFTHTHRIKYHTCLARFEIHHTMSEIVFKILHRSHFDFRNITLTSGVLVLTLVVVYLAKHSYSKSKHHTIVPQTGNNLLAIC